MNNDFDFETNSSDSVTAVTAVGNIPILSTISDNTISTTATSGHVSWQRSRYPT